MASAAYEKYTDRASNFLTRIAHPVIDDPASPEGEEEEERRGRGQTIADLRNAPS